MKKEAFKHDFSGSYSPNDNGCFNSSTFSVGCFQWLPKSSGTGLKKSAIKFRVKGNSATPEKVYTHARKICGMLDVGERLQGKSCTV